jgi:hypothetical protein
VAEGHTNLSQSSGKNMVFSEPQAKDILGSLHEQIGSHQHVLISGKPAQELSAWTKEMKDIGPTWADIT